MLVGYARVSTVDQNLDLQRDALHKAGCERIFEEKKSGKARTSRPEFDAALAFLRPDDVLIVWKLDRLGRPTRGRVQRQLSISRRLTSTTIPAIAALGT